MLNGYKILTVTHRRTPLQRIGEFVVPNESEAHLNEQLASLKEAMHLEELTYLSSCNRVLYFFYTEQSISPSFKFDFFKNIQPALSDKIVREEVILLEGADAIDHLFKVAASIDSLVVGEREILRQLREAYGRNRKSNLTGDHLRIAMDAAVVAAKEVYAKTKLGEKSVSVVSLAIKELLKTNLPKEARILLIGAGQTNALVAKFLKKYGYENVVVFNRTLAKAEKLATMLGGTAQPFDHLNHYKEGFDSMIVCTGATTSIIDKELYSSLLNGDRSKKVVIDLSIPNNVAEEVVDTFDLNYIPIECLKVLAKENLSFREMEVSNACELLDQHKEAFTIKAQHRRIERALHQIPSEVKAVRQRAMNEVFKKEIETLDGETLQLLERMMTYMEKKCTGIPMKVAKQALVTI
ncbi:MAG: glutamyl-tRNA reductase [Bacteroidota bacterium]